MKILVYHGKYGREYWVVDTQAQMNAALEALFNQLDGYGFYADIEDDDDLAPARAGNLKDIFSILSRRIHCEYERWEIVEAIDPCTN